MSYMLDTNTCIYAIKNSPCSVRLRLKKSLPEGVFISAITLAELEYGVCRSRLKEQNKNALLKLLTGIGVLPFDGEAAVEYGSVKAELQKSGTPIGPLDTLIAAHAKAAGLTLVTNNTREFGRVGGLRLENWTDERI